MVVQLLQRPSASTTEAKCVLMVDDEPDIREAVQDLLESSMDGVRVVCADSGRQALHVLKNEAVDLILTDYRMPGMNGVDFLEEADKLSPGIPRIILTAFDRELERDLGDRAAHERILQKPFEPEMLIGLVEKALASA